MVAGVGLFRGVAKLAATLPQTDKKKRNSANFGELYLEHLHFGVKRSNIM